jgi:hypothetical protein
MRSLGRSTFQDRSRSRSVQPLSERPLLNCPCQERSTEKVEAEPEKDAGEKLYGGPCWKKACSTSRRKTFG